MEIRVDHASDRQMLHHAEKIYRVKKTCRALSSVRDGNFGANASTSFSIARQKARYKGSSSRSIVLFLTPCFCRYSI